MNYLENLIEEFNELSPNGISIELMYSGNQPPKPIISKTRWAITIDVDLHFFKDGDPLFKLTSVCCTWGNTGLTDCPFTIWDGCEGRFIFTANEIGWNRKLLIGEWP